MNAAGRLVAYGAGLAVAFGGAFAVASAVAPADAADGWADATNSHSESSTEPAPDGLRGLALEEDGFVLSPVDAPTDVGAAGELTFRVLDQQERPVVDFATSHEKELHLIVVRADGSQYRHVHPQLDTSTGTWSTPWTWDEAGTYRVFADFVPADDDDQKVTLTRTVDVAGSFAPVAVAGTATHDQVDGFDVSVAGDLVAGQSSELTISVERDGQPVTALQPYLGAFGHLVALRQGDLGYLHVHAEGDEPRPGDTTGPSVTFATQAPTAGTYLLFLDFQVDGQVHTAKFVLNAAAGDGTSDEMDMTDAEH